MTTVYIKGINKSNRDTYKKSIKKSLSNSNFIEGDHYIEGNANSNEFILYWITSRITLREFKKQIGANIIWKYRLKFYENIDELNPKNEKNGFNKDEEDLIFKFKQ